MHLEASNVLRALSVPLKKTVYWACFHENFFFFHGLKITGFGLEDIVRGSHAKKLSESVSFFLYMTFF